MRGPETAALLGRALHASAASAGVAVAVEACETKAWHSATFSGERLALVLAVRSGAAKDWLATIGELDVRLPRQLLADLSVTRLSERDGCCRACVDALTVAQD